MEQGFEKIKTPEQFTSKVELHFFRHSMKEDKDIHGGTNDNLIPLSPEGRQYAKSKGEADYEQSIAFGSPRMRTQETALYKMAGGNDEIEGEEGIEELLEKINKNVPLGSKLGVDKRLNFNLAKEVKDAYSQKVYDEYAAGNYFNFMINESDEYAKSVGDTESLTYSRGVQQIVSLIKKYMKIGERWDDIIEHDTEEKYKSNVLKRFMGSHQGVSESFLARLIELTDGKEALANFVELLDNKGFDYVEGYKIDIETARTGDQVIHVVYNKEKENGTNYSFEYTMTPEEFDSMFN